MSNKLDPIHAVASLSLAFIEAQKDISQMRRQLDVIFDQIQTVDQATAAKFKEVDNNINTLFKQVYDLTHKEEVPSATNIQGTESNEVNEKDVRLS
jgi:hypothetical protein